MTGAGTALVIGGTGPTGPGVVEGLLDRGFDVTILHGGQHEADLPEEVPHIHVDPHFAETLAPALGRRSFDLVVAQYGRLQMIADLLRGRTARLIAIGGATGSLAAAGDPQWGRVGRPAIVTEVQEHLEHDRDRVRDRVRGREERAREGSDLRRSRRADLDRQQAAIRDELAEHAEHVFGGASLRLLAPGLFPDIETLIGDRPVVDAVTVWLGLNSFPVGDGVRVWAPPGDGSDDLSVALIEELTRLGAAGVEIDAGYAGDQETVFPLVSGGVPQDRVFMVGDGDPASGTNVSATPLPNQDLAARVDEVGNVCGRLAGTDGSRTVLTGSHVDTVPHGGNYDGALGILTGIAAVSALERDFGDAKLHAILGAEAHT